MGDWKKTMNPIKTIWCDVPKATLKEYREDTNLSEGKEKVIFLVNHMSARGITKSNYIKFRDKVYNIIDITPDYEAHETDKITGELVTK